jgi:translation initiation factor 2B subunit (eIF-2B alpha/beta/delta family)
MENNMNDESPEPFLAELIKQLSTKQMAEFFNHIDSAITIIEKNNPNETRSVKFAREIQNSLAGYEEPF